MQLIIQHLFQAASLEDVPRQRLEAFVEEYPSFGIGRYLLSRKLRGENADSFMTETQKTNLYFSSPFWLQWQLDNAGGVIQPSTELVSSYEYPRETASEEPAATTTMAPADEAADQPHFRENLFTEAAPAAENEPATSAGSTPDEPAYTGHPASAVTLAEAYGGEEEEIAGVPTWSRPDEVKTDASSAAELLLQSIEEAKGLRETLQKINDDFGGSADQLAPAISTEPFAPATDAGSSAAATGNELSTPAISAEPTIEHPTLPLTLTDTPIHDEEPPFVLEEEAATIAEEPEVELPAVTPEPEEAELPAVHEQAPQTPVAEASEPASLTAPAEPEAKSEPPLVMRQVFTPSVTPVVSDALPIFEPYHTIDYFASQGIKLSLDELPNDQLGRQLKSFTDWLKTMRRLPAKDREIIPDRVAEQTVQDIAAHSIESKEIVTETMAEVLSKQGMPDRARMVYEKLSLLNPDKRAYFASKIEQLNFH